MIKLNIISNKKCNENTVNLFIEKVQNVFKDKNIESFFNFKNNYTLDIFLDSKEDLDYYILNHSISYKENVPYWVKGFTDEKCIHLVYPENENIDEYVKTALHEIVHLLSYKIEVNSKRIILLEEGLAYYLANQMTVGRFSKLKEEYLNNKKLLKEFINYSSEEFANNYGYFYGFFLVKFIKNHYSNSKVLFYISNPNYFLNDIDIFQKDFDEFMISEFNKYN